MRFGVFGTGEVGQALATKLIRLGHEVMLGARQPRNEKALAWKERVGERGREGSFAQAAQFGEILINATSGLVSLSVLQAAGVASLPGRLLIDVSNPLQWTEGRVSLSVCNTDSLGEQIQRAFPNLRVIKTLCTVNNQVMVNPSLVPGQHTMFLCGNDAEAKEQTVSILQEFGWPAESCMDLGDITASRAVEMQILLWLKISAVVDTLHFNLHVIHK